MIEILQTSDLSEILAARHRRQANELRLSMVERSPLTVYSADELAAMIAKMDNALRSNALTHNQMVWLLTQIDTATQEVLKDQRIRDAKEGLPPSVGSFTYGKFGIGYTLVEQDPETRLPWWEPSGVMEKVLYPWLDPSDFPVRPVVLSAGHEAVTTTISLHTSEAPVHASVRQSDPSPIATLEGIGVAPALGG